MASAEREPITGVWRRSRPDRLPTTPPRKKNSSDLYQFQERPVAKVGWTCPPRGDATAFELDSLLAANAWFTDIPITWAKKVRLQTLCHNSVKLLSLSVIFF